MVSDDHRRPAKSDRDRSAKGLREPPQVYVIARFFSITYIYRSCP